MVAFCFASAMRVMRPFSMTISLFLRTCTLPSIRVVVLTIVVLKLVGCAASSTAKKESVNQFLSTVYHSHPSYTLSAKRQFLRIGFASNRTHNLPTPRREYLPLRRIMAIIYAEGASNVHP